MTDGPHEPEPGAHDAPNHRNDSELRALLEKIAAQVGDPPEHGLEVLAAMRRRRARHRRGAVATAVVLAVVGLLALPWLAQLGENDDVASVADAQGALPSELPDVLEVNCTPDGIDVPVASIRPRSDGLHVAVDNQLPEATTMWVTAEGWSSGRVTVGPGAGALRQAVPPGSLTVGCHVDGADQQRRVELVDVEGLYQEPELACPTDEQEERTQPLPVDPPTWSLVGATNRGLGQLLRDDDEIVDPGGYPDEHLGDPTVDPVVRIVRDGDTVAFAHLASAATVTGDGALRDGAVMTRPLAEPWSQVRLVEGCTSFLDGAEAPVASLSATWAD